MLGIIRVLTTENENVLLEHGRRIEAQTGIATLSRCIQDQPHGIHDEATELIAEPKILALAKELEAEPGVQALAISCAADPGLTLVREHTDLPVIGAGQAGAFAARMVGEKIAVIGILDEPLPRMRAALGEAFHSYRYSPAHRKATDLFEDSAKPALLRLAEDARREGADVILFACTGFSTIDLKSYLAEQITIPIIDLVEAQATALTLLTSGEPRES